MPTHLRKLPPAEAQHFSHMTFPAYRPLLGAHSLALGAYVDDSPVGLALLAPTSRPGRAELLSLFVQQQQRHNGLGALLLGYAEKTLQATPIHTIHTSWSETLAGAVPFQNVLAKRGWSAPYKRLLVLRGDMKGEFGQGIQKRYAKYQSPNCLPRSYTMTPWHDMTQQDRGFIRSKEGQVNWFPPRANPLREEESMKPGVAMILRKQGTIAGWITVHQTAPDTLRYTDVFIRTDLRRAGAVIIAMLTHCFWLHMAEGTPKLTWGIEADNAPLKAMCQSRLLDFSKQNWTWGAEKRL